MNTGYLTQIMCHGWNLAIYIRRSMYLLQYVFLKGQLWYFSTWTLFPHVYVCVWFMGTAPSKIGSVLREADPTGATKQAKTVTGANTSLISLCIKSAFFATEQFRSPVLWVESAVSQCWSREREGCPAGYCKSVCVYEVCVFSPLTSSDHQCYLCK